MHPRTRISGWICREAAEGADKETRVNRARGVAVEKPRHPRLHLQLPIRFIVEQPETQDYQDGEEMLKDIINKISELNSGTSAVYF